MLKRLERTKGVKDRIEGRKHGHDQREGRESEGKFVDDEQAHKSHRIAEKGELERDAHAAARVLLIATVHQKLHAEHHNGKRQ